MKIIDLLNKIANGEKVPQKIEYLDSVYELNEESFYMNNGDFFVDHINIDLSNLNDEIELIEDEEKDIDNTYWENIGYAMGEIYTCIEKGLKKAFNEEQLDKRTRKEKE